LLILDEELADETVEAEVFALQLGDASLEAATLGSAAVR
jgi:hypothetical protein